MCSSSAKTVQVLQTQQGPINFGCQYIPKWPTLVTAQSNRKLCGVLITQQNIDLGSGAFFYNSKSGFQL